MGRSSRLTRTSREEERKALKKNFSFWVFLPFLGPIPWHMEVPRLGVQWEPLQTAYATATAMRDLSRICDLQHSSQQCQIANPLTEAITLSAKFSLFCSN